MNIGRKNKRIINISESATLSDLAFLLIIFFIVIAVFNINKGFLLELPKSNSSKLVKTEDILRAGLDARNVLRLGGKEVTPALLAQAVAAHLRTNPNLTFVLTISPETQYQRIVEVVEVVRKLKVENFSFNMQKVEP